MCASCKHWLSTGTSRTKNKKQVMEQKYVYLLIGVVIGWITKLPFLIKWYKELRETQDYKNRRSQAFLDEIKRLEYIYRKKDV